MKETRILMGMPVTVEVASTRPNTSDIIARAFAYFAYIDEKFSTYKTTSEISAINSGEIPDDEYTEDMRTIFELAEETKQETDGYFDIRRPDGRYDPSGIVKGWAIWNVGKLLESGGFHDFYVDAGGDIQTEGKNGAGGRWRIGIQNPWEQDKYVKVVEVSGEGVATSGIYIRGPHIYDPKTGSPAKEIASLTVIGPNIYEADRFATAAFAMGKKGLAFIESQPGLEAYMIDNDRIATMTSGFDRYIQKH